MPFFYFYLDVPKVLNVAEKVTVEVGNTVGYINYLSWSHFKIKTNPSECSSILNVFFQGDA